MKRYLLIAALLVTLTPIRDAIGEGDDPPPAVLCELNWMVESARTGLAQGSPAYKKYMRTLLKEAALSMPLDELIAAVTNETDPAMLEVLGAALATRASYDDNPAPMQALLDRMVSDRDPAMRAAALRALKGTGSLETMASLGDAYTYQTLVQDPSPDVRAAVAENLVVENRDVYGGRDDQLADVAAKTAGSSPEPAVAAKLLSEISMERASTETVTGLRKSLTAEDAQLRAASALALGSAPPDGTSSQEALVAQYRKETDVAVRKAILQGLARLGQSSVIPTLTSLRGVAPELDGEIDVWITVLRLGLQEWHLILREKLRRSVLLGSPQ